MKKLCISFLVCIIIILSVVGIGLSNSQNQTEYLRIHVRAESNDFYDQQVKYKVKDALVDYLTPIIATITTKEMAKQVLESETVNLEKVADTVLKENGFKYTSKVTLKQEKFPTRVYKDFVLEEGIYDALIVELGSAKGDNWWCVVYPPLCFTGEGVDYKYKSKIYEIINIFTSKQREEK